MKPVPQVTPGMQAFALLVLHDAAIPLGGHVDRTFAGVVVRAVVETHHNPTASNPTNHPHRGVALYVADAGEAAPLHAVPEDHAAGVDLSHYQRGADLEGVAAAGYSFTSIKVSEGVTLADDAAAEHHDRAGDAGLLRSPYIFFRPATSDPVDQVRRFLDLASKLGVWELPPAIDVEWLSGAAPLGGLTPEEFGDRLLLAVDELVRARLHPRPPLLYTAPGFWAMLKGHADSAQLVTDLWLAHYTQVGLPPAELTPWPSWKFWQWSAKAQVPGVPGNADVDKFRGTAAELKAYAEGT